MASKSHIVPLKGASEQDMLTGWRKVMFHDRGRSKRAKQSYNRRQRRLFRRNPEESE